MSPERADAADRSRSASPAPAHEPALADAAPASAPAPVLRNPLLAAAGFSAPRAVCRAPVATTASASASSISFASSASSSSSARVASFKAPVAAIALDDDDAALWAAYTDFRESDEQRAVHEMEQLSQMEGACAHVHMKACIYQF